MKIINSSQFTQKTFSINKGWKDELLKWNPEDYDGITIMRVPFDIIWTPG